MFKQSWPRNNIGTPSMSSVACLLPTTTIIGASAGVERENFRNVNLNRGRSILSILDLSGTRNFTTTTRQDSTSSSPGNDTDPSSASDKVGSSTSDKVGSNYFDFLGLEREYLLSREDIDRALREKQKKYHPDKMVHLAKEERESAEEISRYANEAVKCLRSPIKRAKYFLDMKGVKVLEASSRIENKDLLIQMVDAYENLEDMVAEFRAEDKKGSTNRGNELREEIEEFHRVNESNITKSEGHIAEKISLEDYESVQSVMERLSLYLRLRDRIEDTAGDLILVQ